ncbi:BON domain-containing protein [Bdellovibrio sp. ZAP7]|uniref:BON domain-containing protein n=1 Tax=Bdellovibrio sp. ZAP7 TaxID=2231053 RepID=UPI00143D185D|nr:BON domain-containing protein [Bdellovibrio sp. ZAP7]
MKMIVSLIVLSLSASAALAGTTNQGHSVGKADDQAMTTQRATDITRMIREKIVADDSLSMKAHNIQIITDNNKRVILKGNVSSADEKAKVERIAKSVAGDTQVINKTVVTK